MLFKLNTKIDLELTSALVSAPVLRFPDFSRPFELHTDGACTAGIGVILCQRDPRNNRAYAVSYASRSLSPAERNYGVSEVEALAIVWDIKKFSPYLTATKFTVITDHHSLQFLNKGKLTDLRGRLARWTLLLQQHDFDIVYRPGSQNAGPDALSRYPPAAMISSFQPSDIAIAQASDPFCQDVLQKPSLPSGFFQESGILFFGARPSPSGISTLYYSPNQQAWVKKMVNQCSICQRVKRTNTTLGHTNLVHSAPSVHPFDTIAIDTFGNRYIIVIQCLFSRYVIPIAVPSNTDKCVIECFLRVIGEHGVFRAILNDNGPPYAGILMNALAKHLKIDQRFAPAYHPQSNGLVERFMETLKNMISSYIDVDNHQTTWDIHLSEFQLAYNSTAHQTTKCSPFSVVHGREARTLATPNFGVKSIPIQEYQIQSKDFLARAFNIIQMENTRAQASNALVFNKQRQEPTFAVNDLVLVDCPVLSNASLGRAKKLVKRFRGPFRVSEILSTDRYNVQDITSKKQLKNVHASRMKNFSANVDIANSNPRDVVSPNSASASESQNVLLSE
ncbi:hypothetical protein G6F57_013048 [Rhizopus arrhizus]|nr:hypothetical protein G6F24_011632 [Rhizopus arrhizus]KAG0821773.1 hypothetical protein G6F19_011749 [Rhizopus arrhizus]KAG0822029.1 hypothetical protein G6F18_011948 [Rhizopus arrhizus]KAG0848186.1 hypothetical protein G6F17_011870 [Rhizopus arrhizus]KAG0863591.1 hypothetical protein G6F16_011681 [Rhizopus arrhizus]